MDKFDKTIKQAQQQYEPREDFVAMTMRHITGSKTRKHWGFTFWAPVLAGGLAVITLVFVMLPSGGHNPTQHGGTTGTGSSGQSSAPQTTAMSSGTSNADLASDMNTVNGAMNQENADQNSANSALNDNSQEIAVPTN